MANSTSPTQGIHIEGSDVLVLDVASIAALWSRGALRRNVRRQETMLASPSSKPAEILADHRDSSGRARNAKANVSVRGVECCATLRFNINEVVGMPLDAILPRHTGHDRPVGTNFQKTHALNAYIMSRSKGGLPQTGMHRQTVRG